MAEGLGHSDIAIALKTYGHVMPTMQELAVDKLEAMLSAPPADVLPAGPENGSRDGKARSGGEGPADEKRAAS